MAGKLVREEEGGCSYVGSEWLVVGAGYTIPTLRHQIS